MQQWDIWVEGYQATGDRGVAQRVATVSAPSFKEACDKYFEKDPLYTKERLTYWGCKLFDNESDARKSFG